MKQLVVISGKGGTGKTSIVAAFAALSGRMVAADCDVDAADLHLVLGPEVERKNIFIGGKLASIDPVSCTGCGKCREVCRFGAVSCKDHRETDTKPSNVGLMAFSHADDISRAFQVIRDSNAGKALSMSGPAEYSIDKIACEGCGVCAYICPEGAVTLEDEENGEWYVSRTRFGPMVHARLHAGSENSGKLVTLVRDEANRIAGESGIDLVLIDGSPGIGCPVIASIAGVGLALVVIEPTRSGLHDLERVIKLTRHFGIRAMVAVNKSDINEGITGTIEEYAAREGVVPAGRIRYDTRVTDAQIAGKSVVELPESIAAEDIKRVWNRVLYQIEREEE